MRSLLATVLSVAAVVLAAAGEEIRLTSVAGKPGPAIPFAEGSELAVASSYDDTGYVLSFSGKGGPKASDVGGSLTVQVRAGQRNADGDRAPSVVRFVFEGDKGRLEDLCYGAQVRDMRRTVPSASFAAKDGRWTLHLRADWLGDLNRVPFVGRGPRTGFWRMTAVYRGADGAEQRLGSAEEPVRLTWERPKQLAQAYSALLSDKGLGGGLWDYYALWNWSWKERWVGYPDAGRETFRWRDAESEKQFHTRVVESIRRECEPSLARLRGKKGKSGEEVPEIIRKGTPAEKDAMFAKLPALRDVRDRVCSARRDYFLDRFSGRAVPELPPEEEKSAGKKSKTLPRATLGDSASDDDGLSLDE